MFFVSFINLLIYFVGCFIIYLLFRTFPNFSMQVIDSNEMSSSNYIYRIILTAFNLFIT